ncbi:ParB/Sulfiredoxin [uncultured Caudovirales phage]|uniref:ParB/Sulfiredoxin n=1 Tax=uncultured Caudovirales phage TaxID=2100421 RepID=A0A6J5MLB3_9CAUD|nr:ParB/Sulfiredoxin [uncultured Caudovirales phage]
MKLKIQYKPIADLIPYARNSRTHSDAQVAQIAASIKEFGWTNPVLLDGENGIIAGHGRVMAAHKLGETEVPTIELSHMDENQKRAYIIADNKLALNADWDNEMLALEINDLKDAGYDLGLIGFSLDEIEELNPEEKENTYTQKVDIPTYEPSAEKPDVKDLFDDTNAFNLIEKIKSSKLPQAEKDFLMLTAGRHVRLNFQLIADYYAHSQREVQELMEDSALVIVDIDNAISNGWVNLSKKLDDIYDEDNEE